MIVKPNPVELGPIFTDVCDVLGRGVNGRGLNGLSLPVCEAIMRLTK